MPFSSTLPRPTRVGGVLLAGLVAVALTGCGSDPMAGFRKREAVVIFKQDTPQSVRLKVRSDCSRLPNAKPEPFDPGSRLASVRAYGVRYRIDKATDQDLSKLFACLHEHDSVLGVRIPENM